MLLMRPAKEQYSELYDRVSQMDDPVFDVLEYFIEESEENDLLRRTDEFVENQDRPYIPFSELQEEFGGDELDGALHLLTGDYEHSGYLETNDHTRRSDYHEPHDSLGRMTDGDIRRMTEYKREIDQASPDELSFRLGDEVEKLQETVELLSDASARETYNFLSEHEQEQETGYDGIPGVRKDRMTEEQVEAAEDLRGSYDTVALATRTSHDPVELHDHVKGEPEHGLLDRLMIRMDRKPERDPEAVEEFAGDSAVIYRAEDPGEDDDEIRSRLVENIVSGLDQ